MIFLEPIHENIRKEMKERMDVFARKSTKVGEEKSGKYSITDLNSRSTFVKMTSGVVGDAKQILGENSKFGLDVYSTVQNDFRPIAGIKDISVEYRGGYKAFRHATVNWTCWSFEDLDELLTHFLIHGRTVLLEWGWALDKFSNEINLVENINRELFEYGLKKKITDNAGNYDAMMGVINNYEWSVRDDGGFDCITEIVAMGVNLFKEETKSFPAINGEVDGLNFIDLSSYAEYFDKQVSAVVDNISKTDKESRNVQIDKFNSIYKGIGYFPFLWKKEANWWQELLTWIGFSKVSSLGVYMTWGWMEDNIICKFLSKVSGKNIVTDFRSLDRLEDGSYRSVQISNHPKLLTTDFTKFVLPHEQYPIGEMENDKIVAFATHLNNKFKSFAVSNYRGNLRNIVLPFSTINEAFSESQTLDAGMNNLFNILNSETGIWDFKIVHDDTHNGRLKVVDMNLTKNSIKYLIEDKSGLLFTFPTWRADSIVKSQTLTSKLPSAMAVSAMYSTHVQDKDNWSVSNDPGRVLGQLQQAKDKKDILLANLTAAWTYPAFGNDDSPLPSSKLGLSTGMPIHIVAEERDIDAGIPIDSKPNDENIAKSSEYSTLIVKAQKDGAAQKKLYGTSGIMKNQYVSAMKYTISKNPETSIIASSDTFLSYLIPLELELEIDGIGGIFPGNAFTSAYLPERYKKETVFQAIDVSHVVDSVGWIVTIKGQMRVVPKTQKATVKKSSIMDTRKKFTEYQPNIADHITTQDQQVAERKARESNIATIETESGRKPRLPE